MYLLYKNANIRDECRSSEVRDKMKAVRSCVLLLRTQSGASGSEPTHPMAIGFLRNTGKESTREAIGPLGRFERPSVKYVNG